MSSARTATPCTVCGSNPFVSNGIFQNKKLVGVKDRSEWTEARCKGYPVAHEPIVYLLDENLAITGIKPPAGQTTLNFKRAAADELPYGEDVKIIKAEIAEIKREVSGGQLIQINDMFLKVAQNVSALNKKFSEIEHKIDTLLALANPK